MTGNRLTLGVSVLTLLVVIVGFVWQWRINEELRLAITVLESAADGAGPPKGFRGATRIVWVRDHRG